MRNGGILTNGDQGSVNRDQGSENRDQGTEISDQGNGFLYSDFSLEVIRKQRSVIRVMG
jgi:hypothetical protein